MGGRGCLRLRRRKRFRNQAEGAHLQGRGQVYADHRQVCRGERAEGAGHATGDQLALVVGGGVRVVLPVLLLMPMAPLVVPMIVAMRVPMRVLLRPGQQRHSGAAGMLL